MDNLSAEQQEKMRNVLVEVILECCALDPKEAKKFIEHYYQWHWTDHIFKDLVKYHGKDGLAERLGFDPF